MKNTSVNERKRSKKRIKKGKEKLRVRYNNVSKTDCKLKF